VTGSYDHGLAEGTWRGYGEGGRLLGEYTMTRGTGVRYQNFHEYQRYKGEMPKRNYGVQIALHPGHAVAYAL